jgi:hypothetical protein
VAQQPSDEKKNKMDGHEADIQSQVTGNVNANYRAQQNE